MYKPTHWTLNKLVQPVIVLALTGIGDLCASSALATNGDDARGELDLKTSRVIVFKDGHGLFVKQATGIADADGRVFTNEVPDGAILGSFWASAGDRTLSMRAEWIEKKQERKRLTTCISILDLLRANQGNAVRLGLTGNTIQSVEGRLVAVLDRSDDSMLDTPPKITPQAATPLHSSIYANYSLSPTPPVSLPRHQVGESKREIIPVGGQFLVIETADHGQLVMPVADVRTVSGAGLKTQIELREEIVSTTKRLTIEMGPQMAGKAVDLNLLYFSEGVRWIPTYRLGGALETDGALALQGELLNEAEDIDGATIDLVVGVPNFRFKSVVSPLSLERTLRQTLAVAAPNLMGQTGRLSNALLTQRIAELPRGMSARPPVANDSALNLAPELASNREQDLYVYSAEDVSLNKGARLTLPLWQNDVPLRSLYTFDLRVVRDEESGQVVNAKTAANDSPLRLSNNKVWHQFELINSTGVPWTTGPALVLRNLLPLAQELLTYTPAGGTVLLPVTVAVDVRGDYVEQELNRIPNALVWDRDHFSLIRKKSTITVTNYRDEASQMRVSTSIGGKVESASDNGVIRINDYHLQDWKKYRGWTVNNHSDVTWEFKLNPGESKSITFEFSFYVR